jgi:hypothetical protein
MFADLKVEIEVLDFDSSIPGFDDNCIPGFDVLKKKKRNM